MENIAIIGAGGIGSHLCRTLHRFLLPDNRQLGNLSNEDFTVFDFDVVEPKNVRWQDYSLEEVGLPKAMLMNLRHHFPARVKRFDEHDVGEYDAFLIAADNAKVRQLIFQHVAQTTGKTFVDMRSEGDIYGYFTSACSPETLQASLGENASSSTGFSCQRRADLENNVVQLGNWCAATLGLEIFRRLLNNVPHPSSMIRPVV
jgi:hypothetical protein